MLHWIGLRHHDFALLAPAWPRPVNRSITGFLAASLLMLASPSHAVWTSIYEFDNGGHSYDVVLSDADDSLDDLFLNGYDGLGFAGFTSITDVLVVGTQSSTADIQNHLVYAMYGIYDPITNPGTIFMAYNANMHHRSLTYDYWTALNEPASFDFGAAQPATDAWVIRPGNPIPEPGTALLVGLGLAGLALQRKRS